MFSALLSPLRLLLYSPYYLLQFVYSILSFILWFVPYSLESLLHAVYSLVSHILWCLWHSVYYLCYSVYSVLFHTLWHVFYSLRALLSAALKLASNLNIYIVILLCLLVIIFHVRS